MQSTASGTEEAGASEGCEGEQKERAQHIVGADDDGWAIGIQCIQCRVWSVSECDVGGCSLSFSADSNYVSIDGRVTHSLCARAPFM